MIEPCEILTSLDHKPAVDHLDHRPPMEQLTTLDRKRALDSRDHSMLWTFWPPCMTSFTAHFRYKIAETFGDTEAMKKILQAPTVGVAEAAMKEIKGFEESVWNAVRVYMHAIFLRYNDKVLAQGRRLGGGPASEVRTVPLDPQSAGA